MNHAVAVMAGTVWILVMFLGAFEFIQSYRAKRAAQIEKDYQDVVRMIH